MKKTVKTKWEQHGNCPSCGAPIFVKADAIIADAPPQAVHTCGCRFNTVIPAPATTPFVPSPHEPYPSPNTNPWQLPDTTIKMWDGGNKTWCGTQTVTSGNLKQLGVTSVMLLQEDNKHPWSYTR